MIELLVAAFVLFGAFLHGITGVGFPMISTLSAALLLPLPTAIVVVALPNIVINAMMLVPSKESPHPWVYPLKRFAPLIICSVLGSMLGVSMLRYLAPMYLHFLLSGATFLFVFHSLYQKRKKGPSQKPSEQNSTSRMIVLGTLAGVIGGATNAMSSILMIYLLTASNDKDDIVRTANVCFLLSKVVQLGGLYGTLNALGGDIIWVVLGVTVSAMAALYVGTKIRAKLPVERVKHLILLMLLAFASKALYHALSLM